MSGRIGKADRAVYWLMAAFAICVASGAVMWAFWPWGLLAPYAGLVLIRHTVLKPMVMAFFEFAYEDDEVTP